MNNEKDKENYCLDDDDLEIYEVKNDFSLQVAAALSLDLEANCLA